MSNNQTKNTKNKFIDLDEKVLNHQNHISDMLKQIETETKNFKNSIRQPYILGSQQKEQMSGFKRLRIAAKEYDEQVDQTDDHFSLLYKISGKHEVNALGILEHIRLFNIEKRRLNRFIRERQIMKAFRSGYSNKEIAQFAQCSITTVFNLKKELGFNRKKDQ